MMTRRYPPCWFGPASSAAIDVGEAHTNYLFFCIISITYHCTVNIIFAAARHLLSDKGRCAPVHRELRARSCPLFSDEFAVCEN